MNLQSKSFAVLVACLIAFAFVGTYLNHFNNGFHFDDSHTIVNNGYIKDLKYFKLYFTYGATQSSLPTNQSYRPIITLSAAVDYWLAGNELDPFYFHLSTFLWVILQGVLMYFIFNRILQKHVGSSSFRFVSLFAVAWYVLHTANAESINYMSARSDIISTALVVAAFVIYQYTSGYKQLLALPIVAIGVLAKPTAVMYVGLLFFYVLLFEKKQSLTEFSKGSLKHYWSSLLKLTPTVLICGAAFWLTRHMEPETWVPGGTSTYHYLITQPFVILRYFWTFFIPINLSADTDWTVVTSLGDARFIFGMLFLFALAFVILKTSEKPIYRPISFGLLWFIIALVPTSSIIPLAEVTNDHRMYYPFVGLVLAASWAGYLLIESRKETLNNLPWLRGATIIFCMMILAGNASGTYQRNIVWSSDETLWHDVTIKSPNNGRGLMNYGLAKMRRAEYDKAIEYYSKALETEYGNHPYLSLNMAICQGAVGNEVVAEKYYEESIQKGRNYPDCHYFYAQWLMKKGDISKARYHLWEVLRLSPGHENAKQLIEQLSTSVKTEVERQESLVSTNPSPSNYLALSLEYYRLGRYSDCISACEKAIALKPDFPEAYNNICSAYNELKEFEKAIVACEKALAIDPNYELARNNLNWSKSSLNK